jgi:membrane associated rhomboid family serine protease
MGNSQKFKLTYLLIALNVIFYIYTSIAGGNFLQTNENMILLYGQVNGLVIYYHWFWQLLTSLFVHIDIVHISGNMLFLLIFGLRAEEMFSLPEYLSIYLLSGLTGNLLTLAFLPLNVPSAGASGAIFGLFGATILYSRRSVGQSIIGALVYAGFLLLLNAGENVNYFAHFGGLAAGLLIGYVIASRRHNEMRYKISYSYSK